MKNTALTPKTRANSQANPLPTQSQFSRIPYSGKITQHVMSTHVDEKEIILIRAFNYNTDTFCLKADICGRLEVTA